MTALAFGEPRHLLAVRASIPPGQTRGTHAPGSASYEHAYDPLPEDRAGNLHR